MKIRNLFFLSIFASPFVPNAYAAGAVFLVGFLGYAIPTLTDKS